jgi:hypothetical protein
LIRLSDSELDAVFSAARPIAVDCRDAFLQAVAAELAQHPGEIGAGVVYSICREQQRRFFDPPIDASWDINQRDHQTKLTTAAPIEGEPARRTRSSRARV